MILKKKVEQFFSDPLASVSVIEVNSYDSSSLRSVLLWSNAPISASNRVSHPQCPCQPARSSRTSNLVMGIQNG
ncbi:hypothetical protein TNCV_3093151 [Trichonephila clavipes]|nr:hypothetical protein TNCV_3093151 [Trichonephila clavipes]